VSSALWRGGKEDSELFGERRRGEMRTVSKWLSGKRRREFELVVVVVVVIVVVVV
jgi:hypothetical protein